MYSDIIRKFWLSVFDYHEIDSSVVEQLSDKQLWWWLRIPLDLQCLKYLFQPKSVRVKFGSHRRVWRQRHRKETYFHFNSRVMNSRSRRYNPMPPRTRLLIRTIYIYIIYKCICLSYIALLHQKYILLIKIVV